MSPARRPAPVRVLVRLLRTTFRVLVFALRLVVVAVGLWVLPPSLVVRMLRHEDPIAQIAEEEKAP